LNDISEIRKKFRRRLEVRPEALYPLFSSLMSLVGIGPSNIKKFQKLDIFYPKDLLFHLPNKFIFRKPVSTISEINFPETIIAEVEIKKYLLAKSFGPSKVLVNAKNFSFFITFFKTKSSFIKSRLPLGERRVVSGKLELFEKDYQMIHPEYILKTEQKDDIRVYDPAYPLTNGLSNKYISKCINNSLRLLGKVHDWLDDKFLENNNWPDFNSAIRAIHSDSLNAANAKNRLIFDELFAHQIGLNLVKSFRRKGNGKAKLFKGDLSKRFIDDLPFSLTGSQETSVNEINSDLENSFQMTRLVQGDVGSGKTVVALATMLNVVEGGGQVALLVPTEILAYQHFKTITKLMENLDISVLALTGTHKGEERKGKLLDIASGKCQVIVGTHALFQEEVKYHNLEYVVIDEQHRFGVNQRNSMLSKGYNIDLLMMSATPIPRSLSMVKYGDIDVSILSEKPDGRKSITTALIPSNKISILIDRLRVALKSSQAYWICPLIEETAKIDLVAAQDRFSKLTEALADFSVGLLHGKLTSKEKSEVMKGFAEGAIDILISTTVIEVGVDVPNASIMIVESAERFGLAQLHQIRGRVGRGKEKSSCTLIHSNNISQIASQRLAKLKETDNGFEIAEFDLSLRGEGDIIGLKQSGLPKFRIADPVMDSHLSELARVEAEKYLEKDPFLETEKGERILYLLNILGNSNISGKI